MESEFVGNIAMSRALETWRLPREDEAHPPKRDGVSTPTASHAERRVTPEDLKSVERGLIEVDNREVRRDRGDSARGQSSKRGRGVFYCTNEYHPIQAGSIDGAHTAPHDRALLRALLVRDQAIYKPACANHRPDPLPSSAHSWPHTQQALQLPQRQQQQQQQQQKSEGDKDEEEEESGKEPAPSPSLPLHSCETAAPSAHPPPPSPSPSAPARCSCGLVGCSSDPRCVLFVARLQPSAGESDVREAAERHGAVRRVRVVRSKVSGFSRGYAFVEFSRPEEMVRAYERGLPLQSLSGAPVLVDFYRQAFTRGWVPRRYGGGLGGKKESGQMRFGGHDRPFLEPTRSVPREELQQQGIPLPPEGRFLHRRDVPPLPAAYEGVHRPRERHASSDRGRQRTLAH